MLLRRALPAALPLWRSTVWLLLRRSPPHASPFQKIARENDVFAGKSNALQAKKKEYSDEKIILKSEFRSKEWDQGPTS